MEQSAAENSFLASHEVPTTGRSVVLCGSTRSFALMQQTAEYISREGIHVILPLSAETARTSFSRDGYLRVKREASLYHFDLIRHPDTHAVLAINPDKDGVTSYIGPNTFADLAIAFAFSRRIYVLYKLPAVFEDELVAWGAVELNGRLERLVAEMRAATSSQAAPEPQMSLPLLNLLE